ncbi:MAG: 5'/3'-nucleotidase SurE [Zestosphaera sp.]
MLMGWCCIRLLLVNDDGFVTKALPLTYHSLTSFGEVVAVVPEMPKSGGAHSLTLHKPLFLRELLIHDIKVYVINGTPVDAVHVALQILDYKPTLVISGVNIGENTSAQNVLYSGTIGAALEAGLLGYPAVAFSADVESDEDFANPVYSFKVRRVIEAVMEFIGTSGWFTGVDALSINIPKSGFKGAVMPRTQKLRFKQRFESRVDPRGRRYYWLVGDRVVEEGTDSYYLNEGYIVVTPLRVDLTHPALSGCSELDPRLGKLVDHLHTVTRHLTHVLLVNEGRQNE